MYGPDNSTAVPQRPSRAAAGPDGLWFTPGNPAAGQQATGLDPDYMNGLLAEFRSILAAAGIAPDKTQDAQLLAAIKALAFEWLGGGVFRGLQIYGNSRTLPAATSCGYFNILVNAPVITIPAGAEAGQFAMIEFACFGGVGVLKTQGDDVINLGDTSTQSYFCTNGTRIKMMFDGGATWNVVSESNLYAPNFRGPASGVTATPTDNSGLLSTTAFAKGVGFRANAYFEFNQANVTIQPSWLGGLIWNDYGGAAFVLPPVGQCEPNTAVTIYALGSLQITCNGGESFLGVGTSIAMTPGTVLQAIPQPAAGGWRLILDPRVLSGRLQSIPISPITSLVKQAAFTFAAGQYEVVRFEWAGLTSNARGQYTGPNGVQFEQFDFSLYVAAGGVRYVLSSPALAFSPNPNAQSQASDGWIEVGPLTSTKPVVQASAELYAGGRPAGFTQNGPAGPFLVQVEAFFGDALPPITEVGIYGVAQDDLAGSDTSGVGFTGGQLTVLAR